MSISGNNQDEKEVVLLAFFLSFTEDELKIETLFLVLEKTAPFQGPLKFAIQGASVCQLGKGVVKLKFLAHFNRHNSFSQTFLAE